MAVALSVVVPCYNEEQVLPEFHRRTVASAEAVGMSFEIVYVNDGSTDSTLRTLHGLARDDPRAAVINLSRNFGKEAALTAGLDHAAGTDAVVVIDADLQDPPELIGDLVARWRAGFDVVFATRRIREGEGWAKRATARAFYRVVSRLADRGVRIPADTGDFRLMSRRAVDALLLLRERHRFMKGLFSWVGFPSTALLYDRAPRAAGITKWKWWDLWNLGLEGITGFSTAPLRAATYVGVAVSFGALAYLTAVVLSTVVSGNDVAGYPSLLATMLFLGGVQMTMLGIIGEYLGRVFNEVKDRPLYVVESVSPSCPASREPARGGGGA